MEAVKLGLLTSPRHTLPISSTAASRPPEFPALILAVMTAALASRTIRANAVSHSATEQGALSVSRQKSRQLMGVKNTRPDIALLALGRCVSGPEPSRGLASNV